MSDPTRPAPGADAPPQPLDPQLDRIQRPALLVAAGAGVLSLIGLIINRDQFFQSYLVAFMFWLGLPLGCLALLMLQHLTGGTWGLILRRMLEAGARMLPLMAVLFLPIVLGMGWLYPWTHAEHSDPTPAMQFKYWWLSPGFWVFRAVLYFAIWIGFALLLNAWSAAQDRTGDYRYQRRMQLVSGPGLLLIGLTTTGAAIDWVMTIDEHWYSTMWGLIFIAGFGLSTIALCTILLAILYRREPYAAIVTRDHFHDLGNLLLAFTMIWAYLNFSQFLIIWSGNIAEETPYYYHRNTGWVKYLALFIVVFHFFVPFLLLLSRHMKRRVRLLAGVATLIIVMRLFDLLWMIIPFYAQAHVPQEQRVRISVFDFVLPLAVGGLWVWAFIWQLRRRPLLPPNDPRLADALRDFHHHHHDHALPAYDAGTGATSPGPRPAGVTHG